MKKHALYSMILFTGLAASCGKEGCTDPGALNYNKKATKDNNSCSYDVSTYTIPTTYTFVNANGQSTVDFSGQTDRLNQLSEMMAYAETAKEGIISLDILKDMFVNTGGNGNGNFSFTSTKQLKDKCFTIDQAYVESLLDSLVTSSQSYNQTAADGKAGVLVSGANKRLVNRNGFEYAEVIEKTIMGGVFMYQALNVYFGSTKMNVDNTTAVSGKAYTAMEHHWDEAFGYFGVPLDFPTNVSDRFWGEYCVKQNGVLSSNSLMMSNFLKGRAAISNNVIDDRDASITNIRETWEKIAAYQAMSYLTKATENLSDKAQLFHYLSEAYGFVWSLRYAPDATRKISQQEVTDIINLFGENLWKLSLADINAIKAAIDAKY